MSSPIAQPGQPGYPPPEYPPVLRHRSEGDSNERDYNALVKLFNGQVAKLAAAA